MLLGTRYHKALPGNSPEFMPLDNLLFQDLELALYWHCAVTAHLQKDNPRKFSKGTPKTITSAIKRIWFPHPHGEEGAPCLSRIVHDCKKCLDAFKKVYLNEGGVVKGLANNLGHCLDNNCRNQHDGKQRKGC